MTHDVSYALYILEEPIQYLALSFMGFMYAIKIRQLLKKPMPPEKAELKGDRVAGAIHSLGNVLRPWEMESTSKNNYFYAEFVIFHIAVALTIGSTFFIPLVPHNDPTGLQGHYGLYGLGVPHWIATNIRAAPFRKYGSSAVRMISSP